MLGELNVIFHAQRVRKAEVPVQCVSYQYCERLIRSCLASQDSGNRSRVEPLIQQFLRGRTPEVGQSLSYPANEFVPAWKPGILGHASPQSKCQVSFGVFAPQVILGACFCIGHDGCVAIRKRSYEWSQGAVDFCSQRIELLLCGQVTRLLARGT
ncbi:hypothetical protein X961_1962 [Burkholderia pseudomallei MSHR5613]|nr:hypothetical protein X961_1962 [Burkholderia pseudomallei MSHR5613]